MTEYYRSVTGER